MEKLTVTIKQLWVKYQEIIVYIFFGGVTTIVNYVVFMVCSDVFALDTALSNVIAWILSVFVAFITNKTLVFKSNSKDFPTLFKELTTFILARILSGVIDTGIVVFGVDRLFLNKTLVKLVSNVFVIIFNYFASKLFIFKKKKELNGKVEIVEYSEDKRREFKLIFDTYFNKEIHFLISAAELDEMVLQIEKDIAQHDMWLYLLYYDGVLSGFSLFQIDSHKTKWRLRPGWGFIREFYVSPKIRRGGLGTRLYLKTEEVYKNKKVKNVYLTARNRAKKFWRSAGFEFKGEICEKNDYDIFEKKI